MALSTFEGQTLRVAPKCIVATAAGGAPSEENEDVVRSFAFLRCALSVPTVGKGWMPEHDFRAVSSLSRPTDACALSISIAPRCQRFLMHIFSALPFPVANEDQGKTNKGLLFRAVVKMQMWLIQW